MSRGFDSIGNFEILGCTSSISDVVNELLLSALTFRLRERGYAESIERLDNSFSILRRSLFLGWLPPLLTFDTLASRLTRNG
jgi:hypothetical protein